MSGASEIVTAAALRPLNLTPLGIGLLLAVTVAPWWLFPIALAVYVMMIAMSVRDPAFVRRTLTAAREDVGAAVDWHTVLAEVTGVELTAPLKRIAASEERLVSEHEKAPEGARELLTSTLTQLRSAGRLAIKLALKVQDLDRTLATFTALNPQTSRYEAGERRKRATQTKDAAARAAFLDAAKSLEESASSAESLIQLRERTVAQLDNLAASLESVAVRTIRLRVSTDDEGGAGEVTERLRIDMAAAKETLGVFEETLALTEASAAPNSGQR